METAERIVEAYCRFVKKWATIPNIRCGGQQEIDLLAIDPRNQTRYHIEVSVSISEAFSELTGDPYDPELARQPGQAPTQHRALGYFKERKFGSDNIVKSLEGFGFEPGNYAKVIVTWGWTDGLKEIAAGEGIELWEFRVIMAEIAKELEESSGYFVDDTIRTIQLFEHSRPKDS